VANQLVDQAVVEFEVLVFLQAQKQVQPDLVGLIDQIQDSLELHRYAQYTSLLEGYLHQVLGAEPQLGQAGAVEQALNLFSNVILPSSAWINRYQAARMSVAVSKRQPTKQQSACAAAGASGCAWWCQITHGSLGGGRRRGGGAVMARVQCGPRVRG
jgi:hypothetical protein